MDVRYQTATKRELLARAASIVQRLKSAPSVCPGEFNHEVHALEQDILALETKLAAAIDDFMEGQLRRHNLQHANSQPQLDANGLSGRWGRHRWADRRVAS